MSEPSTRGTDIGRLSSLDWSLSRVARPPNLTARTFGSKSRIPYLIDDFVSQLPIRNLPRNSRNTQQSISLTLHAPIHNITPIHSYRYFTSRRHSRNIVTLTCCEVKRNYIYRTDSDGYEDMGIRTILQANQHYQPTKHFSGRLATLAWNSNLNSERQLRQDSVFTSKWRLSRLNSPLEALV